MIEAREIESSAESRTSRARAEFVATLGRRLTALANTLHQLEEDPANRERRNMLLRRVHALGSAAKVLGFEGVAEALGEAERALARSAGGGAVSSTDLAEVSRALDILPSIAWGAKVAPRADEPTDAEHRLTALGWPLSILVFGPATLRSSLVAGDQDQLVECEVAEDAESFRELAQKLGPDVAVIDGDRKGARELLELFVHDPLIEPFPAIVVGNFDSPEAASSFVSLGAARVLPKPVGPDALSRAVIEASEQETGLRGPREPIGDVTIDELATRIAAELRRGLVDGVERGGENVSVPLGEGIDVMAAVWGAVARVREVLTMRSGGRVRFRGGGPEGAVPLAPWTGADRRAGERSGGTRRADGVRLEGRRAVVVDDDPAVVWFLSGLLKTSGVEVAEAHDGLRARELVLEGMPDLVVSDVLMPGIDGFALCREIKRDLAVRDVPVILLSWKEDLLQRVRELGAGADGYLRKEAQASTVLQRVREVLRPRARVETRLAAGGEVRGRLDGLTPRLLLELAKRHQPSSRVTVRDAVYLYELELRDGLPRSVTRTATDGGFQRGAAVIDALVGVSVGRFVVTPANVACRDELGASLDELLSPRIRRARAVLAALTERDLARVDLVEIDEESVGAYLLATPEPARGLFRELLNGVGPRELLDRDPQCLPLLGAVLSDIARRGAVKTVVKDGEAVSLEAPPAPTSEEALAELASSAPLFTLELSPAPPAVADTIARWEQPDAFQDPSARLPFSRAVTPAPPPDEQEPSSEGFRDEPRTAPGVGPVMLGSTLLGPEPVLDRSPAPAGAASSDAPEARDAAASAAPEAAEPGAAAPTAEETGARTEQSSDSGRAAGPASPAAPRAESEEPMQSAEPRPVLASEAPTATPPPARDGFEPVESAVALPAKAFPKGDSPSAGADGSPATLRASEPEIDRDSAADEPEDAEPAAASPKKRGAEPEVRVISRPEMLKSRGGDLESTLPEAKKIEFPPSARQRARKERPAAAPSSKPAEPAPAKPEPEQKGSPLRLVAYAGLAAVVAWGAVTLLRTTMTSAPAPGDSAATEVPSAAVVAPAPKPVAPKTVQPKVEELGLPPGVPLANDKGLLEIDIGERHAIYVDEAFVGRGPMRRVPLPPGRHQVQLKTPDGDINLEADVKTSLRTRVTLPPPGE